MATITTLTSTETGANSLIDINANFSNLNTDKIEASDVKTLTNKTIAGGSNTISGITEAMLSTSDNTTLDVTTSKHGLVPKAPNDTTKFLRGDATWAAPAGTTIETTTGTTHSLTTVADQKVVVWAMGQHNFAGSTNETITLKYNGVTKHTLVLDIGSSFASQIIPFALQYTETPGAGTHDITVTSDAGTDSNVVIIVMKIL